MIARIAYHIHKTTLLSNPESGWKWVLIRWANVEVDGLSSGVLPEVDVAVFTSEAEANLFSAYLITLEKQAGEKP